MVPDRLDIAAIDVAARNRIALVGGAAVEILLASSDERNLLDSDLEPEPEYALEHQQDELVD